MINEFEYFSSKIIKGLKLPNNWLSQSLDVVIINKISIPQCYLHH